VKKTLPLLLVLATAVAGAAERSELAARMSSEGAASEYWDLSARFESGHVLLARFLITNQGPGQHTAVALGHLIFPDGSHVFYKNGRERSKWKLEQEGMLLDVGSSELDLRGPQRSYRITKERDGITIKLAIRASAASSLAEKVGPGGYRMRIVDVSAPVEGTIWVRDRKMPEPLAVRGRAALTQTWVDARESSVALRRIDFASLGDPVAVSLVDMTTPDHAHLRWLAVEQDGRIVHQTGDFELSLTGAAESRGERGYPVPASLHFRDSRLDGSVELGRTLLRSDPMEALPQPFRFLLSLQTRPRRVWAESPFEVKFDTGSNRSSLEVRGTGITSVTWLNPLEP
jgi:hypothetical protein